MAPSHLSAFPEQTQTPLLLFNCLEQLEHSHTQT